MSEGSDYFRPLVGTENFIIELNKAGGCYISYLLRVSTSKPITEEDGKELTTALYRYGTPIFIPTASGEAIDESQQIGILIDVNQEKRMQEKIEESFLKDPQLLEKRKQSVASAYVETIFEKAFPVAPLLKPRTLCLVHVVDKLKTKSFIDRCKNEGVTVHTGFCALAERAAVKMIQEKGYRQKQIKLTSQHAADNRVYYKNAIVELGIGMGMCDFTHHVSTKEIMKDFWTAAKKYHRKFKEQHNYMPGIEQQVIEKLTQENMVDFLSPEGQAEPSKKMSYYATTNMRDLTSLLGNIGSNVQLEFLDRLSTIHVIPCIWMHAFHTLNGRFIHSLQYNTHIMDAAVAKIFSETIMEMMVEVSE